MKKKIFLLSIMLIVALTAASDEYIDLQTNVVYTYEPGQPTASVKAGYADVVVPEYGSEGEEYFCPGSPDAMGDVVILDKFTIGTTEYVVTSIGDCAFWYNRKIKSVSIPETVTDIGSCAFSCCTDLTTVQLPSGLMRIAEGLFRNCSHLVTVNIPSSVSTIGAYAFADCSSLASITIPDGLTIVGKFAFNRTPWYVSQYDNAPDGLFYINSLLFGYKGEKPTGELIIKDGTTCVCNEAFRGCKELTSVIIPPSVVYVDEYAFEDCTGLKAVHITDIAAWCGIEFQYGNLNHNSSNPLWYAHHLYLNGAEVTELIVPKGVTRIGKYAFDSCSSLTSVTLSDGVTSIGENAFRNCGNLTNVSIPSSVSKIESHAFVWCKKLNAVYISDIAAWCGISFDNTSNPLYYGARLYLEDEEVTDLIIPEGVSSIGDGAFRNYSYLTSVTIQEGVTSIGKYAFNTCRKITNLSLPTSLSRICYSAFAHCSSLTSIIIPQNVTNIDESAFAECGNLTDVYCLAYNVPETSSNVFYNSPIESATLHVPAGSVDKYKAAEPWSNFGNIVALPEEYYPEGTKWTEIRLDTLKYDSWYSKVGDEWVPNFETIEYYVKGEYVEKIDNPFRFKCVYTSGPEWTDSLTLLILEQDYNGYKNCVLATVPVFYDNAYALFPGYTYQFDWSIGKGIFYRDIRESNTTSAYPYYFYYGIIDEIKEGYFGGVRPLKYVDLDGKAPIDIHEPGNTGTNGGRIIQGIGITEWNDGECLFGPPNPYRALTFFKEGFPHNERNYRSKLVHFERNGEVLYDVWPGTPDDMVTFTEGQMATIILPTTPDASKGKYYRLDRCENDQIVFEEELTPKPHVPYIIMPNQDFTIDLSTLDLEGCRRDSTKIVGVSFIGTYSRDVFGYKDSFYYYILDSTPDCRNEEGESVCVGPLHAFLEIDWRKNNHQNYEKMEVVLHDKPEAYRPFVEEGKVWKVGGAESGNPVQFVEYLYFDGDTIIGGKTCKQMMRQVYYGPNYPDLYLIDVLPPLEYVGAWYEEDKKVYEYNTADKLFKLMYDFSANANDTIQINNCQFVVGPKQIEGMKGFKGVYRDVRLWADGESSYSPTWMEGVGSIDCPTKNVYYMDEVPTWFLMSCTVGDEVIYLNDEYEDGATPDAVEARKVRFDFTHTVKTQPKTPKKKVAEKSLYGEYNAQQLDINLDPLDDTYLVRITDASGKAVYEKDINAGNIVGLNIDISAYTKGLYTVTVENSKESFTGEFNANTTGIEINEMKNDRVKNEKYDDAIYDLQGRKINSQFSIFNSQFPKGLYIVNGKKVVKCVE